MTITSPGEIHPMVAAIEADPQIARTHAELHQQLIYLGAELGNIPLLRWQITYRLASRLLALEKPMREISAQQLLDALRLEIEQSRRPGYYGNELPFPVAGAGRPGGAHGGH